MKAAVYETYGPADVLKIKDVPRPEAGENGVLVQVYASAVTSADWRMRASAFPGGLWLMGRLMTGLIKPRHKILGVAFAGRVVSVGAAVRGFRLGDPVFGFSGSGAHAEYVAVDADGPVARMPEGLGYDEAAAIPFGGLSALVFLRDFGKITVGQKVLVTGASGAVGVFAVQIAKHFGAEVTGVASTRNVEFVRSLGAARVVDYTQDDFTRGGVQYDVVLDTAGVSRFSQAKRVLKPDGVYVPLEFGLQTALHALWRKIAGGKRIAIGVSGDSKADTETLANLAEQGALRSPVGHRYRFADIADAHRQAESRHSRGTVVVTFEPMHAKEAAVPQAV
ncbi:NAD(P)-dependent alcohol dehydrogenase [Pelagibacterium xiamenense]|uniref:NAD(P)-dependent alcohol dehydrogenase n=1 Tax=Pelagibacterium xiamenense TaxID=2901140 RepID=UPI001E3858A8|nr:NAD(P)-dependent alcohol dehydrogenase [Pelagibacterium xiamenense]MCD7060266.1 NAD(P)-dependent alcohol dehydrogenase [Pelagibacterium xiamenense]